MRDEDGAVLSVTVDLRVDNLELILGVFGDTDQERAGVQERIEQRRIVGHRLRSLLPTPSTCGNQAKGGG